MLCPVDRYMVGGSRGLEQVKILEDESWTVEPTMRPEDELVLRRLRDLLQSTADDLKVLSTELAAPRLSSSRFEAQLTPLDEEFNQKVHIEQMVNAKFHGERVKKVNQRSNVIKMVPQKLDIERKRSVNTGVQVDLPKEAKVILPQTSNNEKPTQSNKTRDRESDALRVNEDVLNQSKESLFTKEKMNDFLKVKASKSVVYDEILHVEQEIQSIPRKILKIQDMPSINIRGELRQQQVLQLDIFPQNKDTQKQLTNKNNTAVIEVQHKSESLISTDKKDKTTQSKISTENVQDPVRIAQTKRKVLKMSTYESSDYNSSDARNNVPNSKKGIKSPHVSPKSILSKTRNVNDHKFKSDNTRFGIDDWKKKLNSIYGQASTSRQDRKSMKTKKKTNDKNISSKQSNIVSTNRHNNVTKLNNAQYVPYSQLTLGGVRLSDIEREVPDINKKADEPLSPILDRMLSEKKISAREKERAGPKVLNSSDENLLQEVVEIEKNVNRAINSNFIKIPKNISKCSSAKSGDNNNENPTENSSYDDDFEEERQSTDPSWTSSKKENTSKQNSDELKTSNKTVNNNDYVEEKKYETDNGENSDVENSFGYSKNKTYIKSSNLSFKDSVDVFEFIHSVDTQDTATQSNRLLLKETQTSPRQDISPVTNVNSIHNDLWQSSIDPKGEIEKMFKLEKDFIRKLILDEYGDILEKDITKPSTSKEKEKEQSKNVAIGQKNTQTSPAHVKSIMTSPKRTKTRTTSPAFSNSLVHRHTSPLVNDTVGPKSSGESQCDIEDLGISVNLSSPRFTLKLPQTSREVLSNLEPSERYQKEKNKKDKATIVSKTITSSSSIDTDRSDSEFSSLGEVNIRLRRKQLRDRLITISDSSSTSAVSKSSSELRSAKGRLKSEGEISLGQLL